MVCWMFIRDITCKKNFLLDFMGRNSKIAKNTLLLYVRMFLVMGISLYTSRVILHVLGVEDFGIYNIVGTTVVLFSFVSNSLTIAIQRYLSFALGQNDIIRFIDVFNQGFYVFLLLSIVLIVVSETIGLYILYNFVSIPTDRFQAALWVYQFSMFSFIFSVLKTPYSASLIAYEKMSFFAYMGIVEVVLKLLVVYVIVIVPWDKLTFYSGLLLMISILLLGIHICYCSKYLAGCRLRWGVNRVIVKELLGFSSWTLLTSGSQMLTYQGVNILLNNFWGVIINAATGIANQIMGACTQFLSNFQVAFNPQLVKSYASGDMKYFRLLLYRTSIASFYLMMLVTIPLIVEMDYILFIWLSEVPPYTEEFSICIILSLLIESYSGPIWMAIQATGKIKKYQIVTSLLYLLNFVGSFVLLIMGYSPISAFIIRIFVSLLALWARTYLLNKMVDISLMRFFTNVVLRSSLIYVLSIGVAYYIRSLMDGFAGLCMVVLGSLVCSILLVCAFGFERDDRIVLKQIVFKRLIINRNS